MKTARTLAALAAITVTVASGLLLWRSHNDVLALRQHNRALQNRIAAIETEKETRPGSPEPAPSVSPELLRLRGEVAQLRRQTNEIQSLQSENAQLKIAVASAGKTAQARANTPIEINTAAAMHVPREAWTFAGYASPEDTLKSAVWAMSNGDSANFLAALSPSERARMERQWQGKTDDQITAESRREMEKLTGFRILDRQTVSDEEVLLSVYAEGDESDVRRMRMKRFGSEWKFDGVSKVRRREPTRQ